MCYVPVRVLRMCVFIYVKIVLSTMYAGTCENPFSSPVLWNPFPLREQRRSENIHQFHFRRTELMWPYSLCLCSSHEWLHFIIINVNIIFTLFHHIRVVDRYVNIISPKLTIRIHHQTATDIDSDILPRPPTLATFPFPSPTKLVVGLAIPSFRMKSKACSMITRT